MLHFFVKPNIHKLVFRVSIFSLLHVTIWDPFYSVGTQQQQQHVYETDMRLKTELHVQTQYKYFSKQSLKYRFKNVTYFELADTVKSFK